MEGEEKKEYNFDGQRLDETVVGHWHQHPWVMFKTGLIITIILFIGLVPLLFFHAGFGWTVFMYACIAAGIIAAVRIYVWWSTIYILTDQRIIGFDQSGVLSSTMNEVPLDKLQNITHTKTGIGATIFNYGTVSVRTAGGDVALRLKNVENPLAVQQSITETERKIK